MNEKQIENITKLVSSEGWVELKKLLNESKDNQTSLSDIDDKLDAAELKLEYQARKKARKIFDTALDQIIKIAEYEQKKATDYS